jgi:hypothetical protein
MFPIVVTLQIYTAVLFMFPIVVTLQMYTALLFMFPIVNKIELVNKFLCSPLMKFDSNTFNGSIKTEKNTDRLRYYNSHSKGAKTSPYGKEREGHLLAVMTSKTDNMIYFFHFIFFA